MDAHTRKTRLIDRWFFIVVVSVLGVGLWECYGEYFLGRLHAP